MHMFGIGSPSIAALRARSNLARVGMQDLSSVAMQDPVSLAREFRDLEDSKSLVFEMFQKLLPHLDKISEGKVGR